jgi:hypothetical protein
MERRLRKLREQALERQQWPIVAAIADLIEYPDDLDRQINFIGSMHQMHFLRNRLRPWWKAFDVRRPAWVRRCIERMTVGDCDCWAVSALLGNDEELCTSILEELGFQRAYRFNTRNNRDAPGVSTLWGKSIMLDRFGFEIFRAIELGWDNKDPEAVNVTRYRYYKLGIVPDPELGRLFIDGRSTSRISARLPYGWSAPGNRRVHLAQWQLLEDCTASVNDMSYAEFYGVGGADVRDVD